MRIIVVGATGTIGSEVVRALSRKNHDVLPASRASDLKVDLDNPASVRAMFEQAGSVDAVVSCAGNAAFKPFAELTDADYELGLRSKPMGQVLIARMAKDRPRRRLDYSYHGHSCDAPDAGKRIHIDGQCRARRLRAPRRSKCCEGYGSMRSARPG